MKWIIIILILAGVGGFFTRPEEAVMRTAADAVLNDPGSFSEGLESLGATLAGERAYSNYYVAAKYDVSLDGTPVVNCWGAFTQVRCTRVEDTRTGG
jgi:hypothetical protein